MPKILVVYLATDPVLFNQFLKSYWKFKAGIDHEVAILYKSRINSESELVKQFTYAAQVSQAFRSLSNFRTAYELWGDKFDYFVLLNSYSEIDVDNWLAYLYNAISNDRIGIAGCTGSFESFYTNNGRWYNQFLYPPFPNPHIRTSGCIIRSEHMKFLPLACVAKVLEHYYESGYGGINYKLLEAGYSLCVVDRFGTRLNQEEWPRLCPFRSEMQDNLMIKDKQTKLFDEADNKLKQYLTTLTWGNKCEV